MGRIQPPARARASQTQRRAKQATRGAIWVCFDTVGPATRSRSVALGWQALTSIDAGRHPRPAEAARTKHRPATDVDALRIVPGIFDRLLRGMGVLLDIGSASFGKRTSRFSTLLIRGPGPVLRGVLEPWGPNVAYADVEATDDPRKRSACRAGACLMALRPRLAFPFALRRPALGAGRPRPAVSSRSACGNAHRP